MDMSGDALGWIGSFTRVGGITRVDRPVYQHTNKRYLYFNSGNWMIGPDYSKNGGWIFSGAGNGPLDAHLVPPGSWKDRKDGAWQINSAIAVTCTMIAGMLLAAAQSLQTCLRAHRVQPRSLRPHSPDHEL